MDNRHELGVSFVVRNSLLSMIEPPTGDSERILILRLSTSSEPVNIVTTYAPTLYSNPDVKDQFYNVLDHTIETKIGRDFSSYAVTKTSA